MLDHVDLLDRVDLLELVNLLNLVNLIRFFRSNKFNKWSNKPYEDLKMRSEETWRVVKDMIE